MDRYHPNKDPAGWVPCTAVRRAHTGRLLTKVRLFGSRPYKKRGNFAFCVYNTHWHGSFVLRLHDGRGVHAFFCSDTEGRVLCGTLLPLAAVVLINR